MGRIINRLNAIDALGGHHIDLNLYLSSAKRFADTSIKSYELVTLLATPETGFESRMDKSLNALSTLVTNTGGLHAFYHETKDLIEAYRLKRERHLMQSAFNVMFRLRKDIKDTSALDDTQKQSVVSVLNQIRGTADEILDIDLAINAKFKDFLLQEAAVRSASGKLVNVAKKAVENAREKIKIAYGLANALLAIVTLFGLAAAGGIAWILHTQVTRRITRLTHAAEELREGHLTFVDHEGGQDELGRLGRAFNFMAGRLRQVVDNLEHEVSERTSELKDTNKNLQNEIYEREGAERRFRLAAEAMSDLIYEWDVEQDTLLWFGDIDAALGYSPGTFPRTIKAWVSHIHPEDLEKLRDAVAHHRVSTEPINYEYQIRHLDGTWCYWFDYAVPLLTADGRPYKWIGICKDITEQKRNEKKRKQLEEQLRQSHKMEAIGTLAGGIAHDFNNILGIIIGNAELALNDTPDWNPVHTHIHKIKIASLRAKDVVRQLLSFSRKTDQQQKPVDISPVLRESLKLIRSSTPSHIEIRGNIPESTRPILADATQIHQVLINLCTNAIHAMSDHGGILSVSVRHVETGKYPDPGSAGLPPGACLELSIRDTGVGIDKENREKIFDPYFTTKEVGKGTGMGLSVVHGIVKNHNGQILVDSMPGKGTAFTIRFPIAPDHPEKNTTRAQKEEDPKGKERVLFIDDEESITDIAGDILETLGYSAETVTDPLEALSLFENNPASFDLIISDMTMPGMNGMELSGKLRAVREDIPIIICTGHSTLIDEETAKEAGIAALAMKPITMSEMAKLIRNILD